MSAMARSASQVEVIFSGEDGGFGFFGVVGKGWYFSKPSALIATFDVFPAQ